VTAEVGITTRSEENLVLARQIFNWVANRDTDAFVAALAPDVEAYPSIDGAPVLRGRDAVVQWWREISGADGDVEARPLEFEAEGDCVIVRGYLRHRSGRTLSESQVYWLYEIREGQIACMESHPTRKAVLASARRRAPR
jgi:ketosteroid isomerase-like protein